MAQINITPFAKLTRHGIPEFEVVRRPLELGGEVGVLPVGARVTMDMFSVPRRARQYYEQRRIAPVAGVSSKMLTPAVSAPVAATPPQAQHSQQARQMQTQSAPPADLVTRIPGQGKRK